MKEQQTEKTVLEQLLLDTYNKPELFDPEILILTTTQITSEIVKADKRINVNKSIIRMVGMNLVKNGYVRTSFRRAHSKYPVYGWKVKRIKMPIPKIEETVENEKI
jgi:hypothetical protein